MGEDNTGSGSGTKSKDLTSIFDLPKTDSIALPEEATPESLPTGLEDPSGLPLDDRTGQGLLAGGGALDPVSSHGSAPGLDDVLAGLPPVSDEVLGLDLGEGLAETPGEETTDAPVFDTEANSTPDSDAVLELDAPLSPPVDDEPIALDPPTPLADAPAAVRRISEGLDRIKSYSESLAPQSTPVAAQAPYSLLIDGRLRPHERERLLQILGRENIDIREIELEPQFEAGRVLIPRVSEYVGVLIVQALRGSRTRMRLGPSERIFASRDAREDSALVFSGFDPAPLYESESGLHPAERIAILPSRDYPGRDGFEVRDTIHATVLLKAGQVESPTSGAYLDAMDAVKRQLRHLAHHRGADAILQFSTKLEPMGDYQSYRLLATGVAVRLL